MNKITCGTDDTVRVLDPGALGRLTTCWRAGPKQDLIGHVFMGVDQGNCKAALDLCTGKTYGIDQGYDSYKLVDKCTIEVSQE